MPKPIKVKIYYDENLKAITGKDFEEAVVSENLDFRMFLNYIFTSYPDIMKKFIPGTLGFGLNGESPKSDTILNDGDELRLVGYTIKKVREGVRKRVEEIIGRYGVDLDFETIERMIYEEKNKDDFDNLTNLFAEKISDMNELNKTLQIVNAAWNCFPHKCLNGLCPMEKLAESQQKSKE